MTSKFAFAAFILTNGRPDNVVTHAALRRSGYTGPIFLLVDTLDPTAARYAERYRQEVVFFDKEEEAKETDSGDNFHSLRGVIYARNASFTIAKKLGITHFVQLDDDYQRFQYRFDEKLNYAPKSVWNLNRVFAALIEFFEASGAQSVAMAQGGDYIGGEQSALARGIYLKRKCMNLFVCSTARPFKFLGRINEDVTTYTRPASTGDLFFTTNQVNLNQIQTQSNPGGMTELYLDSGTYVKSFYSVMYQPSSVKVSVLRDRLCSRLHHSVSWKHTTPMILRESLRKT